MEELGLEVVKGRRKNDWMCRKGEGRGEEMEVLRRRGGESKEGEKRGWRIKGKGILTEAWGGEMKEVGSRGQKGAGVGG